MPTLHDSPGDCRTCSTIPLRRPSRGVYAVVNGFGMVVKKGRHRQRHSDGQSNKCPCCTIHLETAEHVLLCPKEGQVEVFMQLSMALEWWLNKVDTDPELVDSIVKYVPWQGIVSMEDIVQEAPSRFHTAGKSQDKIGWRWFLEGMILKEISGIQQQYYALNGMQMSL
jgi:hypothetical protein